MSTIVRVKLWDNRDLFVRMVGALLVAFSCALTIMPALSAQEKDEPQETSEKTENANNGAVPSARPPTRQQRNPRRDQNIDEPALDPMFGPRRQRNNRDTFEDPENEPTKVRRLEGFTSILTLLTPEETDISVGIGPVVKPDYFGSDNYEIEPDPQVYIKVRNFVFFDDDGADLALLGFSGFRFGPSLRIVGDRDEDENPALTGLGDVGTTFELGGFAATTFLNRYSFKFKVRRGIATGHRGLIVDAFGTALLFRYGRFSSSISAQASWIGNQYADTYFSINAEQSANSGLPQFDARSGFRNLGGSLNGYVNLGKRWSLNPYISYDLIIGNIQDTPIIADFGDREQVRAGFHLIRQFTIF